MPLPPDTLERAFAGVPGKNIGAYSYLRLTVGLEATASGVAAANGAVSARRRDERTVGAAARGQE